MRIRCLLTCLIVLLPGLQSPLLASGPISSGVWVKLKISREGVYKITYTDLQNAGFDVSSLDPRKLQLRGHQCGMIPEENGTHIGGMPEIPILVNGESDGKFDAGDYVLFYGGSKDKWFYNGDADYFEHRQNQYSDEGFLYFGLGDNNGLRIQQWPEITQPPDHTTTKYTHVYFHDSDMVNPISMGRTWLGEKLGNETLTRNFTWNMPSDISDSMYVRVSFAGAMYHATGTVRTDLNGEVQVKTFSPLDEENEGYMMSMRRQWIKAGSKQVNLGMELTRPNTLSAAWLDFVEISGTRPMDAVNTQRVLRNPVYTESLVAESRLAGSGNMVWNVSDEMNPRMVVVKAGSGYEYFRSNGQGATAAFAAFNLNNCYSPEFAGAIANANILDGEAAEFIIIAHPDFMQAANDLAAFRRDHDGYSVKIVNPQAIYYEYSATQQDIVAIRDYLRDEYNKSLSAGKSLQFVLLMGSTSFDPKSRVPNNTNFVPVYQNQATAKSQTYCLDDFYAYLDTTGGNPNITDNKMWFAVGRIPARTAAEANGVVAKLKRYASEKSLGPWRSELTFVCDDVDKTWEAEFIKESEKYTNVLNVAHPDLVVNKVYADAYKQVSTGNTEKYPEVSSSIDRYMNSGSLFLNYQGHGGERGWAQESILTVSSINAWNNSYNMPVLFTATCEFGTFDNPALQSGGEHALLNPNGGAIGLITTTRLVYVSGNSATNYAFWSNHGFPKPYEPIPTIGEIYRKLKNRDTPNSQDVKYALMGDPSMRLAFPEHGVVLDSINGKAALSYSDTLKAFSVVKMKGHIEKRSGGKFDNFNGTLWVKVFDKPQTKYTLDNDKHGIKEQFKDQSSYIFKGVVTVINGEFSIVFAVPKDIAYNVGYGKISLYAHNGVTDANGAQSLLVGSSEDNVKPDYTGPKVKLYMNDTTFIYGGNVQPNSIFIAKVFDSSGINATGAGIGRDITAILDPGTIHEKTIILNDYFSYNLNSYTSGSVYYNLEGLVEGKHIIQFKVWDIHNISAEEFIEFNVVSKEAFVVSHSFAKPNPFQEEVSFCFQHNLSGKNLKAHVTISDISGRKFAEFDQELENANFTEDRVVWNGRSAGFSEINAGLYLYRVDLVSEDGRKTAFYGKVMKN